MGLERRSGCKINLLLNILGKRPDGFHELETVIHPIPVYDLLSFAQASRGVELTCSHPTLPTDSQNLVYRAATRFLEAARIRGGVRVHLEKEIPLAAGLGGGSGNAAATLLGLNELFGDPLCPEELQGLAVGLGSDVPFFLQLRPALGTGRGECIQPLEPFRAFEHAAILLVYPGFGISTAWTYQQLARYPAALSGRPGRAQQLVSSLQGPDPKAAALGFYNSLEPPALQKYPLLQLFQEFFRAEGALGTLMSGSGSTTFAVASSPAAAEALREGFKRRFGTNYWTTVVPARAA